MIFMDAGGITLEAWNQEHVVRRQPSQREIQRLQEEVDAGLAALAGEDVDADVVIQTIGPEDEPDVPLQTIFPVVRS